MTKDKWPAERVSKLDAARRQLRTAHQIVLRGRQRVSTYTLAAASHEMLRRLVKAKGGASMLKDSDHIKPEYQEEYEAFMNEPQNFFKHAGRDPNKTLEFKPQATPYWILDCIMMDAKLADRRSSIRESIIFMNWFMTEHPQLLKPGAMDPIPKDIRELIKSTGNSKGLFHMVLQKPERYPMTDQTS